MNEVRLAGILILAAVCTTVLAYAGVGKLREWAQTRLLDVPNSRSSHFTPTPRGGGLLIVLCSLLGLWMACIFLPGQFPAGFVFSYSAGSLAIALVSWLDDLRSVPNRIRFATHATGALCILAFSGSFHELYLSPTFSLSLGWTGGLITFFWITGLTNAYNFMDGIDGIAAGQAVVGGVAWVFLGLSLDEPCISLLGGLVAGSSLGFLAHNWPPAHIFMGDVGSAFLGYTLSVLPVLACQRNPQSMLVGALVVYPFIFDTTFTFICRLRRRENVFAPHRSHLYQRLIIAGYSHRFVTLLYVALAFIGSSLAYGWVLVGLPVMSFLVLIIPATLCLSLWRFVVCSESKKPCQSQNSTSVRG